ncbi:MAG: hypothetical protein V1888_03255 [archaeon]
MSNYFCSLDCAVDHFFGNVPMYIEAYVILGSISLNDIREEIVRGCNLLEKTISEGRSDWGEIKKESVLVLLDISKSYLDGESELSSVYVKALEIKGKVPKENILKKLKE